MHESPEETSAPRRGFLKRVVATAGALPLAGGMTAVVAGQADSTAPAAPADTPEPAVGYLSLSADEAAFVESLVNVMCPADAYTPSGVECGLAVYIDRQLAGDFGHGAKRYARGPWLPGVPQQGLQLPLTPEQHFKAGVEAANRTCIARHGKPFEQLDGAAAVAFVNELAADKIDDARVPLGTWFNELVYPLFTQGCFADPIYGGNVGKVFWKLIGYPGLPATHTVDMVRYRGKPYPGAHDPKSIADFS